MNKKELTKFINENAEEQDFTGGVSEIEVKLIEKTLNIDLPNSYKWFLMNFGSGGIYGIDILGCGKTRPASVITQTNRYRKMGLPNDYVVIEDCNEFIYCLTPKNMLNGECQVILWDRTYGFRNVCGNDFIEFISNRILDSKENWE